MGINLKPKDEDEQCFEDVCENELPVVEKSPMHKFILALLGVFMIIFFMSYFVLGPNILSIIGGFVESSRIDEDNLVAVVDNVTIVFTGEVYSELKQLYMSSEGNEFKACLLGAGDGKSYNISSISMPKTYGRDFNFVVAEPCPAGTLVDFHSHPENHCIPSYQDVKLFQKLKEKDLFVIMGVMCNLDRFNFYR